MRLEGLVEKGWGSELIWASNEKYCGKLMNFNTGAKFSMHFHREKDESWLVISGKFLFHRIHTHDASTETIEFNRGDTWRNLPLEPHQLECIEAGSIIEVSTPDSVEDNYRIMKGDSQI